MGWEKKHFVSNILGGLALVAMIVSLYSVFFYAPIEQKQKLAQKIFYFHVPSAWVSFLAFLVVFLASILYLWKRDRMWDILALSSAELGLLFCSLVLITGPIWGKPVWGTWWSWDARLTTTLVLWLIYVAYLMLGAYGADRARSARFRAVLGIVGFADVPLIYVSIRIWRTLHPGPVLLKEGGAPSGLPPAMFHTLMICVGTFTLLYLYLLLKRISVERAEEELAWLRDRALDLG